MALSLAMLAT